VREAHPCTSTTNFPSFSECWRLPQSRRQLRAISHLTEATVNRAKMVRENTRFLKGSSLGSLDWLIAGGTVTSAIGRHQRFRLCYGANDLRSFHPVERHSHRRLGLWPRLISSSILWSDSQGLVSPGLSSGLGGHFVNSSSVVRTIETGL